MPRQRPGRSAGRRLRCPRCRADGLLAASGRAAAEMVVESPDGRIAVYRRHACPSCGYDRLVSATVVVDHDAAEALAEIGLGA